jgi:hypothetical protein
VSLWFSVSSLPQRSSGDFLSLLSANRIAYLARTGKYTQIVVRSLKSGVATVIEQIPIPQAVQWLTSDGDWLLWTSQNMDQKGMGSAVTWQIVAFNLANGTRTVLGSSSREGDPFPPRPVVRGGHAAWSQARWHNSYWDKSDVVVADLVTGTAKKVMSHVNVVWVAIAGSKLVYVLNAQTLMSMPLAGRVSSPLSNSVGAQFPTAYGNLVVWEGTNPGGVTGLLARVLPNGPATVAVEGSRQGIIVAGPDFVLFTAVDGLYVVRSIGGKPTLVTRNWNVPSWFTVQGHQIAWGGGRDGAIIRVFTATVG